MVLCEKQAMLSNTYWEPEETPRLLEQTAVSGVVIQDLLDSGCQSVSTRENFRHWWLRRRRRKPRRWWRCIAMWLRWWCQKIACSLMLLPFIPTTTFFTRSAHPVVIFPFLLHSFLDAWNQPTRFALRLATPSICHFNMGVVMNERTTLSPSFPYSGLKQIKNVEYGLFKMLLTVEN